MMLSPGAIGAVSEVLDASDFYRESHAKVYRAALALYAKGEPVDAITLVDELEERGELEGAGGRVRIHELAALVPASANAGHYARIVREMATLRGLIRAGGEISQLGWERPGDTTDLVDRAEQVVFDLSQARVTTEFTHIEELLKDSFERITALYEAGSRRHRDHVGLPRPRQAHVRLPARQPDHRRRPPVDGEVGPRPLHGRQPRRARGEAGRALHARDVEVGGDAAADVQRGEGRVTAPAHRQARRRRLAAADRRLRPAREGADLRRRHGLDHDDGDPLEGAAAEVARAQPRADRGRLHAADDLRRDRGEPRPGGVADLAHS